MGRKKKLDKFVPKSTFIPPDIANYIDNYLKIEISKFMRDATIEKVKKIKGEK